MNDEHPTLPGLTRDQIDRLMDPHLSVQDRMTTWQPKSLSVQARKVLQRRNSEALRHHYLTGLVCIAITMFVWLIVPLLPASSQMLDTSAVSLALHIFALTTLLVSLLQALAMTRTNVQIQAI